VPLPVRVRARTGTIDDAGRHADSLGKIARVPRSAPGRERNGRVRALLQALPSDR
jgi:hypothetical protein